MGLFARLLGNEMPRVRIHPFPKAVAMYKRDRILLDELITGFDLIVQKSTIEKVVPSTDKLVVGQLHGWNDNDPCYVKSSDRVPAGLDWQMAKGVSHPELSTLYYISNSNPDVGTVKLANETMELVDLTDEGLGELSLIGIDEEYLMWEDIRQSVTSKQGAADTKHRRLTWDESAEGILEIAESRVAFTSDGELYDELVELARWLTYNA